MANQLGSLVVSLGMDAAEFTRGMSKAEADVKRSTDRIATQFKGMGTALAGLGLGTMFVSALRETAAYGDEVARLSALSGTSAQRFQELAFGAKTVSIQTEKLADIFKDVRDKVGDFVDNGGGPLKDFFEKVASRVGVTAEQFKNLSGPEALQLYVKTMERAGVSHNGVITGMEAIASDSSMLLPLLQNNSQGFEEMAKQAQALGVVMSDQAVEAARSYSVSLTKLQEAGKGITHQMMGPLIQSLADGSSYFLKVAGDVGIARAAVIGYGAAVARLTGSDEIGRLESQAKVQQNLLRYTTNQIEIWDGYAKQGVSGAAEKLATLRADFDRLVKEGDAISSKLKGAADESIPAIVGTPLQGTGTIPGLTKPGKDPYAESTRYLESLQKQLNSAKGLTELEKALDDVQSGRLGKVLPATLAQIKATADLIDKTKEQSEADKARMAAGAAVMRAEEDAVAARNESYQQGIEAMLDATPTRQLEKQRQAMIDLATEYERGRLGLVGSAEAMRLYGEAAATYLGLAGEAAKETDKWADRMGASFSSAFEKAIVDGENLGTVLRSLAKDAASIAIREAVTKPLGNSLASSITSSGIGKALSSFFSFDGGGYTGYGPRSGGADGKGGFLALLHPNETVVDHARGQSIALAGGGTSIVQHITIDARGADAGVDQKIMAAMARTKADTLAAVQASANRGGSFARSMGRA